MQLLFLCSRCGTLQMAWRSRRTWWRVLRWASGVGSGGPTSRCTGLTACVCFNLVILMMVSYVLSRFTSLDLLWQRKCLQPHAALLVTGSTDRQAASTDFALGPKYARPRTYEHTVNVCRRRLEPELAPPQEALVQAVSDRTSSISRGDGGAPLKAKHSPADVDDWAFLNTKLSNESVTQQVRPPAPPLCCWLADQTGISPQDAHCGCDRCLYPASDEMM